MQYMRYCAYQCKYMRYCAYQCKYMRYCAYQCKYMRYCAYQCKYMRYCAYQCKYMRYCAYQCITCIIASVQDWKNVQAVIGKTGKMSLKRRIQDLDVNTLNENTVLRTKSLLKDIKLEDIVIISAGAATFYNWVRSGPPEGINECVVLSLIIEFRSCTWGRQWCGIFNSYL